MWRSPHLFQGCKLQWVQEFCKMGKMCSETRTQAGIQQLEIYSGVQKKNLWVPNVTLQGYLKEGRVRMSKGLCEESEQSSSVSRKRECKAMKFVEDTNSCGLRSSEQVWTCWGLCSSAVEARANPKGLGSLFPQGYFHFSFLSLWLMLTHPWQLSSVTTFPTFPFPFLTPPCRHPPFVTHFTCILQLCLCFSKKNWAALTVHGMESLGWTSSKPAQISVPIPFCLLLVPLCASSFCRIGENIPCWCLSPSALLVQSHFPCSDPVSREAGEDFPWCSTDLDQSLVLPHETFPSAPHQAVL